MKRLTVRGFNYCAECDMKLHCAHYDGDFPACEESAIYDRLAAIEDILGDDYELDRLRELVEADKDERCVVVPVTIGATVYHITTCKDFPKVLDGTLYDDNGALGTATGYYCPCELAENCPFDAEDFDCDKNKNKLNIFEDTVEEIHIGECEEYFLLNYSGVINSEDIGKTVFLTREEALAALKAREQDE